MQDMELAQYRLPQHYVDFISYLVARGVGTAVIRKQTSVAQKVLAYLETKSSWDHYDNFCDCIMRWVCFGRAMSCVSDPRNQLAAQIHHHELVGITTSNEHG